MSEITKIVITGTDTEQKSSAIDYISKELKQNGAGVIVLKSTSDSIISQLENEQNAENEASQLTQEKRIILIENALLSYRLKMTEQEFSSLAKEYNLSEDLIRSSYDAVFHLESQSNESSDTDILALWTGTPHLRIITGKDKCEALKREVFASVGIPEPLEIERKFLIEYPDIAFLNSLRTCRREPITQAYLTTPEEGNFRIRKRGREGHEVYIKTKKIKISDIRRIEVESFITKEEYDSYLSNNVFITGIISKDRYCIAYDGSYYELDVYPFWSDRATLEIELLSEEQEYTLPNFVKVIKEVTFEPDYRNLALAQKYYSYFKKN